MQRTTRRSDGGRKVGRSPSLPLRHLLYVLVGTALAFFAGCGSDLGSILYQSGTAAGQTVLDQILTDVANGLADAFDDREGDETDDDDDDDADGDDDPNGDDDDASRFDDLTGDPVAGGDFFGTSTCTTCHCEGAIGGCAADAPALIGVEAETLDERLSGVVAHPGGTAELTDQEFVDLEAYLAGLGDGSPNGSRFDDLTGDPIAGESFFGTSTCTMCHCADATGGCVGDAPALIGMEAETLDEFLSGEVPHTGGTTELADQEIADLAAYLGSL